MTTRLRSCAACIRSSVSAPSPFEPERHLSRRMMLGVQIGFDLYVSARRRTAAARPFAAPMAPAPAA